MTEPKDYTKPPGELPEAPVKIVKKAELTGAVVRKKKGVGKKIKDVFFGGDFKSTAYYVLGDVLLPAFRDMLVDAAVNGAKKMVYGESGFSRRRTSSSLPGKFTYNSPIDRRLRDPRETVMFPDQPPFPPPAMRSAPGHSSEIILTHKEDAEVVAEQMVDIADKYDFVSVADMNEILGQPSAHTAHKWGWTNLNKIEIRQVPEGYVLALPEPQPYS